MENKDKKKEENYGEQSYPLTLLGTSERGKNACGSRPRLPGVEDLPQAKAALQHARESGNAATEAEELVRVGELLEYCGDYSGASNLFQECLQDSLVLYADSNISACMEKARFRLGLLQMKRGELKAGTKVLESCLKTMLETSSVEGWCRVQLWLACLYTLDEARGRFRYLELSFHSSPSQYGVRTNADREDTIWDETRPLELASNFVRDYVYMMKCRTDGHRKSDVDRALSSWRDNAERKMQDLQDIFLFHTPRKEQTLRTCCSPASPGSESQETDLFSTVLNANIIDLEEVHASFHSSKEERGFLHTEAAQESFEDLCSVLAILHQLAASIIVKDDLPRTCFHFDAAVDFLVTTRDAIALHRAVQLAAKARCERGAVRDWPKLAYLYHECVRLSRMMGKRNDECEAMGLLGAALAQNGEQEAAIGACREHLSLVDKIHEAHSAAPSVDPLPSRQLAAIEIVADDRNRQGDHNQAFHDFTRLLKCAKECADTTYVARACQKLSIIALVSKNLAEALHLHEAHLEIAEEMGDDSQKAFAHGTASAAYLMLGEVDRGLYHQTQQEQYAGAVLQKVLHQHKAAAQLREEFDLKERTHLQELL
jgi:tetratricopeptide (TPR) repeat protein